ncbi:MAG: hypothetical protein K2H52_08870 [Lachnospiraceae bacterium]|nr:hypothetical protein [Lachnospiraceae bacterium]MDE6185951.1 hypothetical protein [Lachnospiraceae bacterium]
MEKENQGYGQETAGGDFYGYTGNPFEQMDYGLCKKCRHRTIDRSENPDSELCKECREELIKLKIPPAFYLNAVIVLFLMVFTMLPSMGGFVNVFSYESAQENSEEGFVVTIMDNLISILDGNPDNIDVAIELTDLAMKYSYYEHAAYTIENFLVGKEVPDKAYYRINGYIDELNTYYDTIELSDSIWEEIAAEWEDEEDVSRILNAYCEEISAYLGDADYDQALLYYYLASMTEDAERRTEYLEECVAINPCYYEAQAQIAVYYRRKGDLDKAREILEDIYATNREDYSILRAYATLELAEGNIRDSIGYARGAYEAYPEGDYVVDTYAVALAANDRMEEAWELVEEYEDKGYEFDDDFYDFLDGKITLEDYYIGE